MFESATVRLTAWYVVILMSISIAFSGAIYISAANAVDARLHRFNGPQYWVPQPLQQREDFKNYNDAAAESIRQQIISDLIRVNLFVLLVGGGLSYLLARRTLRPIEEALEAQSRFTADASHELRTPLTAMKTEIEVALRDKTLNAKQAKTLLESNLEEIEKLQLLSNGLLKLAQKGSDNSLFVTVSVGEVIKLAVDRLDKVINQTETKIKISIADQQLQGDKDSLIELFVVLIDNAIKYSPDNKEVSINAKSIGGRVEIDVIDKGRGIKASELPHIFDRFYRADDSRSKEKIDGYGLGLSIAKQIVDMHNGSIEASSTPTKGTRFRLKFPLA